jgi:hypothetical protein
MWRSKKEGASVASGRLRMDAPAGAALDARVEMEAMRPSSRTTMG